MSRVGEPAVLLDTDVLSYYFGRDPVREPRYRKHYESRLAAVAFVSVGEMRFGALRRGWGRERLVKLENFFEQFLIVETNQEISALWAQIRCDAQRSGKSIEKQDAWIAAVALFLGVPLITHNASDFECVRRLELITEPDPKPQEQP